MNDNRKSILEQALDAVKTAYDIDTLSDLEFRKLLNEFRAKLAAKDLMNTVNGH